MQVTVKELIQDALTMLMVYSPDIILTAEESNTALRALNSLIESLANESFTINAVTQDNFNMTGGKASYSWGVTVPASDFTTSRPIELKACTVAISGTSGNVDMPVAIIDYDDYAAISLKTLQTNYPQYVYATGSYPAQTLTFYPVPSSSIPVTFYSYKQISEFTSITEFVNFPQGYYRMLQAMLAVELAPSYQLAASQNIIDIANSAKRNIMRTNAKSLTSQTAPELMGYGGAYNIFSDKFGGR
jgi:hypothetical protein